MLFNFIFWYFTISKNIASISFYAGFFFLFLPTEFDINLWNAFIKNLRVNTDIYVPQLFKLALNIRRDRGQNTLCTHHNINNSLARQILDAWGAYMVCWWTKNFNKIFVKYIGDKSSHWASFSPLFRTIVHHRHFDWFLYGNIHISPIQYFLIPHHNNPNRIRGYKNNGKNMFQWLEVKRPSHHDRKTELKEQLVLCRLAWKSYEIGTEISLYLL